MVTHHPSKSTGSGKKSTRHKTKGKIHRGGGKGTLKSVGGGSGPVKHTARHPKKRTLSLNGKDADDSVKFGRVEPYERWEKPRLILDSYLKCNKLPVPAGTVDRATKVDSFPMYLNDRLGDCTCACVGHEIQAWTAYAGAEVSVSDNDVLKLYEAVSGYDPRTGDNDNGAVIQDVLEYWQKTGIAGHKIVGFAELTGFHNLDAVKTALDLFGSVYLGVNVPESAMDQFNAGEPWTVVKGSPIEGGHAIPLQKFNGTGDNPLEIVTWGQLQPMSIGWWNTYVEEAWVIITQDWLDAQGETIEGLDLAQLKADMGIVTTEAAA